MTHRADAILDRVVTLCTGLTTTGSNVFRGRVHNLPDSQLPAIGVYLGADEILPDSSGFDHVDSVLTVRIEPVAKSTGQVDSTLLDIRAEVVVALQVDPTLGLDYVIDTTEGTADEPQLEGEGNQPLVTQRLAWHVHYRRPREDPAV